MNVDGFKLPVGILGLHPEDFYGAMGRIVCLSAVLEDKVTSLRHALDDVEQGRFTHQGITEQIKAARALSGALPEPAADRIDDFLTRADAVFKKRNQLVHSSFPAQPTGRIWGHRPARSKTVTDGRADTVDTSIEELKAFIADLATLVRDWHQVFQLSAYRPGRGGTTR